ncbi:MAG: SAP domain-containing protein [Ruminococcus sp.]|nr:SAP domain-containing protein [Ruminococcus sp.]
MNKRPELTAKLDAETFRKFYYLKEELTAFCRENGLPASGSKAELTDRIAVFLDSGTITKPENKRKTSAKPDEITESTVIEENITCSEKHRAFFKEKIGKGFSFNVRFQKWLKSNAGKTYADAIDAYYQILEEKKTSKTVIDKQFEYNTYIRDFFADNKGRSLEEAIKCWKYKKVLEGHNRYEPSDLSALEGEPDA